MILLVDDDKYIRSYLTAALESVGYRVMSAADGAIGFTLLNEFIEQTDLLLSDVEMPHMGGIELCEKAKWLAPRLPIILMSGGVEQAYFQNRASALGAAYLQKPFSLERLLDAIKQLEEMQNGQITEAELA